MGCCLWYLCVCDMFIVCSLYLYSLYVYHCLSMFVASKLCLWYDACSFNLRQQATPCTMYTREKKVWTIPACYVPLKLLKSDLINHQTITNSALCPRSCVRNGSVDMTTVKKHQQHNYMILQVIPISGRLFGRIWRNTKNWFQFFG